MVVAIEDILTRTRARGGRMGVKTAADYVGAIAPCLTDGRCREYMLSLADPDAWTKTVEVASSQLVYDDDSTVIDGGLSLVKWPNRGDQGDGPHPFGRDSKKLPSSLTPGAIMDFECVVTSSRKDRMGDILESAGASLDPQSPLLYMHIPFEVPGKLIRQLAQNSKRLTAHLAIMDSPLGMDCARMVEFGSLRISHGFQPTEYELLDEDKDDWRSGFWIKKYTIHEVSLVSVPANTDAIITLHSRQKMLHPLNVAWAEHLKRSLPHSVVGGWTDRSAAGCDDGHKSCECGGKAGASGQKAGEGQDGASSAAGGGDGTKDGNAPRPKMSKKNLSRLKDADELVAKAQDGDIPKPEKALLAGARAAIGDVIKDGENATQDDQGDGTQGGKSVVTVIPATVDELAASLAARMDSGETIPESLICLLERRFDRARSAALEAELSSLLV